jgi:hypothetical protein
MLEVLAGYFEKFLGRKSLPKAIGTGGTSKFLFHNSSIDQLRTSTPCDRIPFGEHKTALTIIFNKKLNKLAKIEFKFIKMTITFCDLPHNWPK